MAIQNKYLQALLTAVERAKTGSSHTPTCDDAFVKIYTRHNGEEDEVVIEFKQSVDRGAVYECYLACGASTSLTVFTLHNPEGFCFVPFGR